MVDVIIIVREIGKSKPDYSLTFNLPEIPREGNYISINRPDKLDPFGEDLIVRHVWWRLSHPETGASSNPPKKGKVTEIFVECDPALGPYASDKWRVMMEKAKARGVGIPEFDVDRYHVKEADLTKQE